MLIQPYLIVLALAVTSPMSLGQSLQHFETKLTHLSKRVIRLGQFDTSFQFSSCSFFYEQEEKNIRTREVNASPFIDTT